MVLLPVLDEGYYFSVNPPFADNHHKFLYNFEYLRTSVTNSIIIGLFEISFQLLHNPLLDHHGVFVVMGLLGNFKLLLPFVFLFFVEAYHLSI